jgi:hypothetical protein
MVKYRRGVDPSWRPEFDDLMDLVEGTRQAEVLAGGGQAEVRCGAHWGGGL